MVFGKLIKFARTLGKKAGAAVRSVGKKLREGTDAGAEAYRKLAKRYPAAAAGINKFLPADLVVMKGQYYGRKAEKMAGRAGSVLESKNLAQAKKRFAKAGMLARSIRGDIKGEFSPQGSLKVGTKQILDRLKHQKKRKHKKKSKRK